MQHILHCAFSNFEVDLRKYLLPAASILLLSVPLSAMAQTPSSVPVPASEQPGARALKDALRRIARNRNNVNALIDAGNAALLLGDASAAANFFRRAEVIRPNDGRVKAGIGASFVRQENPFEALRYFDLAARLGVSQRAMALDRGLAYDLLGNFEQAQRDYTLAATWQNTELLQIRHAISLSLSGKVAESDRFLVPLLNRNSPAAWRAQAFMLAARGKFRDSREVARGFLDSRSAQRVEPFLRRMPDLTSAQQAAAIHLGHFPARNIGRDYPNIKIAANSLPGAVPVRGSDRLTPVGRQLGSPPTPPGVAAPSLAAQLIAEAALAANNVRATAPVVASRPAAIQPTINAPPLPTASPAAPLPTTIAPKRILTSPAERIETVPVVRPAPVPVAQVPPPVPVATAPALQVALAPTPAPRPAPVPVAVPQPAPIPQPVKVAAAPATQSVLVPPAPIQQSIPVAAAPAPVAIPATPEPVAPAAGFDSLAAPATSVPTEAVPAPAVPAPVQAAAAIPAIAQAAPVAPAVATPAAAVPAPVVAQPAPVSVPKTFIPSALATPPVAPTPTPEPVNENSVNAVPGNFDLGNVVDSIAIPPQEKAPAVQTLDSSALPPSVPAPRSAVQSTPQPAKANVNISTDPRYWVQISTGPMNSHKGEYRRLSRKYSSLFSDQEGWSSAWKNTGRLVVGPFSGYTAAKEWYEALKEAGGDGFVWNSARGTEVIRLNKK